MFPFGSRIRVFVSYSHKDSEVVKWLESHLEAINPRHNIRYDKKILFGGVFFGPRLELEIIRSHLVLLLIDENFIRSEHCQNELEIAKRYKKTLVPVLYKMTADEFNRDHAAKFPTLATRHLIELHALNARYDQLRSQDDNAMRVIELSKSIDVLRRESWLTRIGEAFQVPHRRLPLLFNRFTYSLVLLLVLGVVAGYFLYLKPTVTQVWLVGTKGANQSPLAYIVNTETGRGYVLDRMTPLPGMPLLPDGGTIVGYNKVITDRSQYIIELQDTSTCAVSHVNTKVADRYYVSWPQSGREIVLATDDIDYLITTNRLADNPLPLDSSVGIRDIHVISPNGQTYLFGVDRLNHTYIDRVKDASRGGKTRVNIGGHESVLFNLHPNQDIVWSRQEDRLLIPRPNDSVVITFGDNALVQVYPQQMEAAFWTPDSSRLYFIQVVNGVKKMYQMGTNGTPIYIADANSMELSPDGTQILYSVLTSASSGAPRWELRTMPLGGGPSTLITEGEDGHWSPDGRHILYKLRKPNQFGNFQEALYEIDLRGMLPRLIIGGFDKIERAGWMPRTVEPTANCTNRITP